MSFFVVVNISIYLKKWKVFGRNETLSYGRIR